jgi:hypothetical protein
VNGCSLSLRRHLSHFSRASAEKNSRRGQLKRKFQQMFQFREYALAGGLMSYGIDLADTYPQIGLYVARILKGAKNQ